MFRQCFGLLKQLFRDDIMMIKWALLVIITIILFMLVVPTFFLIYPFNTVDFLGDPPITILNKDKKVENGSVVRMKVDYTKYINTPGLTVRTLIRITSTNDILPLDSSTVMSLRRKGSATSYPVFLLNDNPDNIGKNCQIVFSIYYTLYGFRHIQRQFISESFEIVPRSKPKEPCLPDDSH